MALPLRVTVGVVFQVTVLLDDPGQGVPFNAISTATIMDVAPVFGIALMVLLFPPKV